MIRFVQKPGVLLFAFCDVEAVLDRCLRNKISLDQIFYYNHKGRKASLLAVTLPCLMEVLKDIEVKTAIKSDRLAQLIDWLESNFDVPTFYELCPHDFEAMSFEEVVRRNLEEEYLEYALSKKDAIDNKALLLEKAQKAQAILQSMEPIA